MCEDIVFNLQITGRVKAPTKVHAVTEYGIVLHGFALYIGHHPDNPL
jgi:hypothetical protein